MTSKNYRIKPHFFSPYISCNGSQLNEVRKNTGLVNNQLIYIAFKNTKKTQHQPSAFCLTDVARCVLSHRLRPAFFFFYLSKTPKKCIIFFAYLLAFAKKKFRRCLRFENQIFSKSPHTACATLEHFMKSFLILKGSAWFFSSLFFLLNDFKKVSN